jgi:nucleotide-binding universal stress UspA family protein
LPGVRLDVDRAVVPVTRSAVGQGTIRAVSGTIFELGTDGPSRILVGIDGTDTSLRAAAYAAGMARRQGSHLIALYVAPTTPMAAQMAATAAAMIQTQDELGKQLRAQVMEGARHVGVDAEFVLRRGNPYRELIAVANELRVDAVVVGASMQSGRRFVGSLAGRLVRDATWPVTVVP